MSSQAMRASRRADAPLHARFSIIRRRLKRFRPDVRGAVIALARQHVRLAELAVSFPALLLALAWPRHGFDPRPVIAGVIAGVPLDALAGQARVPLWLRRVEPALLVAPLPLLPDSALARRCLVNHLPQHPKHARNWFATIALAHAWADEAFVLWCAKHRPHRTNNRDPGLRLLALWAWFSSRRDTPAGALIEKPWAPAMAWRAAVRAALAWRGRVDVVVNIGAWPLADLWHQAGEAGGYAFTPLSNAALVDAEAAAMENCLRNYSDDIAFGVSRIWSVRKDGVRVATLEVARVGEDPVARITQLRLVRNGTAPKEMWLAAHAWLAAQPQHLFEGPQPDWDHFRPDAKVWQALWKPYWLEKHRIPRELPLVPDRHTLCDL